MTEYSSLTEIDGRSNVLTTTFDYVRDSEGLIAVLAEDYGSSYRLNTIFGDMFVVSEPADIKTLFGARPGTYEPLFNNFLVPLVGEHSLFMLSGDEHKRDRKLLSPMLKTQAVANFTDVIADVASRHATQCAPESVFDAQDLFRSIVIEVMVRFVFGDMPQERVQRYVETCTALEHKGTPAIFLLYGVKKFFCGLGPWRRFEELKKALDDLVYEDLVRHRKCTGSGDDLMSKLMQACPHAGGTAGMSDVQIRDHLMTIILAGFGTTALSLAWGFFWLHHNPEILAKLKRELDGIEGPLTPEVLRGAKYLEAVVKEVLRMNPVVNLTPLRIKASMTLAGRRLPPDTIVANSIWMAHHLKDTYGDPETFRPERFLEGKFTPFEYMPFGGGTRRCVGAAFADYEMRVIYAQLLRNFTFDLRRDDVPRAINKHLFVSPEGGVPMARR